MEDKTMRKANGMFLLLVLLAGTTWAQSKAPSVVIVQRSQTDKPAAPGKSEAATAAEYLENQILKKILDQYRCVKAATDRDLKALLDWDPVP